MLYGSSIITNKLLYIYKKFDRYCAFCSINGETGFGPVPRVTIMVERKGQIRDWPKKASYLQKADSHI